MGDTAHSQPVTAQNVEERLDALEYDNQPVSVVPLSAAERLARLEVHQTNQRDILREHSMIHSKLASGIEDLVSHLGKLERKLLIAVVILFAGTSNGEDLAKIIASFIAG